MFLSFLGRPTLPLFLPFLTYSRVGVGFRAGAGACTSGFSFTFSPSDSPSEYESAEFPDMTEKSKEENFISLMLKMFVSNKLQSHSIIHKKLKEKLQSKDKTSLIHERSIHLTIQFQTDVVQAHSSEQYSIPLSTQHDPAHSAHQAWVLANTSTILRHVVLPLKEVFEPLHSAASKLSGLLSFPEKQQLS